MDLNDYRKELESYMDENLKAEYFALLRQWFSFKFAITKSEFDSQARKILVNKEQVRAHNNFLLALCSKRTSNKIKPIRTNSDRGVFEYIDFVDYVQPSSPTLLSPTEFEERNASAELFIPDSGFVATRIALIAWENGLDGAVNDVTDIVVQACHTFIKNILTAMISRKKSYKVRDNKFQYGFNLPVPDPFLRNYNNITGEFQESKIEVENKENATTLKCKGSLDKIQQQMAFAYSCSKRQKTDNVLTVKLLYETLKENPRILGLYEIHSLSILKLGMHVDE